ncbi:MAG: hypothetical protein JKY24_04295 [Pseudomonadales bacterium]|nr:hypothetical protein [Pseudomonadales bacterium]
MAEAMKSSPANSPAKSSPANESPQSKWGGTRIRSDDGSDRSVSSKDHIRMQLEADIASFMQTGGQVEIIAANVTADPPKKPTSNYGSRPI